MLGLLFSTIEGSKTEDAIKIDEQTATLVSSLLRNSAERAAANAPIIINRDSQLFKNYQQQRLPRRADGSGGGEDSQNPHKKRGIFREDTDAITPIPYLHDGSPILYKPSTTEAPEVTNEIFNYVDNGGEYFQQSQDEPVESLEQQLINTQYEALKEPPHSLKSDLPSPHHISKLPPIDSDLYTLASDSLSHLNFDSYSLAGQFVRPRPNKFQNFPNKYQSTSIFNDSVKAAPSPSPHPVATSQEISYTTTTTENQYKTDFGYKVVPKPTEAAEIVSIVPVTEPVRPFIPIFESFSSTTSTTTTTTTTTTPITTSTAYTKPVVFKELSETVKPEIHQEVNSYQEPPSDLTP